MPLRQQCQQSYCAASALLHTWEWELKLQRPEKIELPAAVSMRLVPGQHGVPNSSRALDIYDGSSSKSFWLSSEGLLDATPLALKLVPYSDWDTQIRKPSALLNHPYVCKGVNAL